MLQKYGKETTHFNEKPPSPPSRNLAISCLQLVIDASQAQLQMWVSERALGELGSRCWLGLALGLSWRPLGLVCTLLLVAGHAEKLVCLFSHLSIHAAH